MYRRRLSLFIFLFILTLAGCKTIELQSINLPLRSTLIKEPAMAESLSSMPDDAATAVSALATLLNGSTPPPDVIIMPSLVRKMRKQSIQDANFTLEEARLYQYQLGDTGSVRSIEAVADFKNRLGRGYQSRITARYRIDDTQIRIIEADAASYFGTSPRTVCFIMPAEKLPCRANHLPETFETLYRLAAEHALTPRQAASVNAQKDWGMAVFYLDRVSPSAKVELGVSADAEGSDGYTAESRYLDYNGWRIAFVAGRYLLMNTAPQSPLFLKASFTPGNEAGLLRRSTTVGLYPLTR